MQDIINIALCDDERAQTDYLKSKLDLFAEATHRRFQCRAFTSAEAFLFEYRENNAYDMLFLDIEMDGMNGIELARELRKENDTLQIIFITGYPDYIGDGYDVSALHYLLKPVSTEKLFAVCTRAMELLEKQPRCHLLPVGKEVVRVFEKDILYGESEGHYVNLHVGKTVYKLRMTIPELEKRLGGAFFKCSRSFVVGLRHVARVTKTDVFLEDGTSLPLGKGLYDSINTALIKFLREL